VLLQKSINFSLKNFRVEATNYESEIGCECEAALYGEAYPFGSLALACEANGGEEKTSGNTRMDSEKDELVFFNFSLNFSTRVSQLLQW